MGPCAGEKLFSMFTCLLPLNLGVQCLQNIINYDMIGKKGHVVDGYLASNERRWQRVNRSRPLPVETLESIRAALRTRITYASNAIEGHKLTLAETHVVLTGVTIGGKSVRDHLEAIDHADAWDAVFRWAHLENSLMHGFSAPCMLSSFEGRNRIMRQLCMRSSWASILSWMAMDGRADCF